MRWLAARTMFVLVAGCSESPKLAQLEAPTTGELPPDATAPMDAAAEPSGTTADTTGGSASPATTGSSDTSGESEGTDPTDTRGHDAMLPDDAGTTDDSLTSTDGSTASDAGTEPGEARVTSDIDAGNDDTSDGTHAGNEDATASYAERVADLIPTATCSFAVQSAVSEAIATVGIVSLNAAEGALHAGYVEYGLDQSYGLRAPLDRTATDYRTVLLGMRQASDYHYRVVARSGDQVCASEDAVITTGTAPAELELAEVETPLPDQVEPGFLITTTRDDYAVIYDDAGELVWWFPTPMALASRATLSWNGRYMYVRDSNEMGGPGGEVLRISVDGQTVEPVTVDTGHHDMAAAPDDSMLFLTGGGCGGIHRLSADGELALLYDLSDVFEVFGTGDTCHCNSIDYNVEDDSITVSCLYQNAYVKVSAEGKLLWTLVGNNDAIGNMELSDFTGDLDWGFAHGHDMVAPDRMVFFNNGYPRGLPAIVRELQLDLDAMTATEVWGYEGGEQTAILGDVQRLPGGNTLVTYSSPGVIHEVNADKQLVRFWRFPGLGYALHVRVLYGPSSTP